VDKHRLMRNGEIVPLTPKAVETLRVLVERAGVLVERDQLMDFVWPDTTVEPGNLDVTMSKLRNALKEKETGDKFIETVPRLGYRFVAEVRKVVEAVPALVIERQTIGRVVIDEEIRLGLTRKSDSESRAPLSSPRRWLAITIAASAAILAVGGLAYSRFWKATPNSAGPASIRSLAVLPFKTLESGDENRHQGLGMADILITRLSHLNKITVRPTSAVIAFENQQEDSVNIARKLQVDAVLEGSIYRAGDKVRITSRLIRVSDQKVLWSGQFERLSRDELQLENEIALQVVDSLALNLSRDEHRALSRHYTENDDAYRLYLKGRYEWNRRNYAGLAEAQRLFRNAIEKDSNFALAYVGLADSLVFFEDSLELNSALRKAFELDQNLAEAHATRGFLLTVHHWRWQEAEESFKKSIELNSGYATAHHWYAVLLGIQGRVDEAKAEMQRALAINPISYNFLADMGQIHYFNREYDKAKDYCHKALEINPDFSYAHRYLYDIRLQTGEYEGAIEEFAKANDGMTQVASQVVDAETDRKERLRTLALYKELYQQRDITKFMRSLILLTENYHPSRNDPSAPYEYARIYAFLGDKEKALDNLERAFDNRAFMMTWVKAEPAFDNLRAEPRYQAILKKMNL